MKKYGEYAPLDHNSSGKNYLPVVIVAGLLLVVAAIVAVALMTGGSHPSAPAEPAAPSSTTQSPQVTLDAERLTLSRYLYVPVPNPRTAHVQKETSVEVVASRPVDGTKAHLFPSSCMVYPDGQLYELGPYQDRVLTAYRPTGTHGPAECDKTYAFWEPATMYQ